jgi:hypothetical protein
MSKFWKAVFITTLVAGTADLMAAISSALIQSGKFPAKILHYIAGGALGLETTMKGGTEIAVLGLLIHFFLAFSYTLAFFLLYPRLKFLQKGNTILIGLLYGCLVGVFMTFIVLPLTALPESKFVLMKALQSWLILAVALGLPIAILAKQYYKLQPGV